MEFDSAKLVKNFFAYILIAIIAIELIVFFFGGFLSGGAFEDNLIYFGRIIIASLVLYGLLITIPIKIGLSDIKSKNIYSWVLFLILSIITFYKFSNCSGISCFAWFYTIPLWVLISYITAWLNRLADHSKSRTPEEVLHTLKGIVFSLVAMCVLIILFIYIFILYGNN